MPEGLDAEVVQIQLNQLYEKWRVSLWKRQAWFDGAVPPHLLKVTQAYCSADTRILFYGQETRGWSTDEAQSLDCFIGGDCTVDHLVDLYGKFNFAAGSPSYRSPLWRAFRDIQALNGSGVLWTNLCRSAYEASRSHSFLNAPEDRRAAFVLEQTPLLRDEIKILRPHAVIFATGPNYDWIMQESFAVDRLEVVRPDLTERELARVVSPFLPDLSFRTYHPNFLNRQHGLRWPWLTEIRSLIERDRSPSEVGGSA